MWTSYIEVSSSKLSVVTDVYRCITTLKEDLLSSNIEYDVSRARYPPVVLLCTSNNSQAILGINTTLNGIERGE